VPPRAACPRAQPDPPRAPISALEPLKQIAQVIRIDVVDLVGNHSLQIRISDVKLKRDRNPPPAHVSEFTLANKAKAPLLGAFVEPTPGFEPGTPSLRVALFPCNWRVYRQLTATQCSCVRSELLTSGHFSGHGRST
jgi:hypothetical protein